MKNESRPLADLMRPSTIDDIVGQKNLLGENGLVRRMVDNNKLSNLILWGPPGCGKTTIARALANTVDMDFVPMSAVFSGSADIKKAMDEAKKLIKIPMKKAMTTKIIPIIIHFFLVLAFGVLLIFPVFAR